MFEDANFSLAETDRESFFYFWQATFFRAAALRPEAGPQSLLGFALAIMSSNFISGTALGVAVIGAGVGTGVAGLVVSPVSGLVQGAEKGGILGATVGTIGGLLAGVLSLTVGVVGGTAVGLGLMVKGIWDTPGVVAAFATDNDLHGKETIDLSQVEAIQMGTRDWDARSQTKVLDEAVKETEYVPKAQVKDRAFYDLLGSEPIATASELKRRYYVLARQEHPDKGGDVVKFQKIGEAYAVLSDPVKRRRYDEQGMDGVKDEHKGDPGRVFAMMFGEDKFEDDVGDLMTVMQMRLTQDPAFSTKEAQAAELNRLQNQRERNLAKKLALRLDGWLSDKEGFVREQIGVFEELFKTNMGPQMCASIGVMWELTADAILGVKGRFNQLGFGGGSEVLHQLQTASRMAVSIHAMAKEKNGAQESADAAHRDELENNMFNIMALDIESTVGTAAKLCLFDSSIDKDTRRARAAGLYKLGLIFQGKLKNADEQPEPSSFPLSLPSCVGSRPKS